MISKEYSFSIVIPCRNEKKYIANCLQSIFNQSYNNKLIEIVIVDGCSDDGTLEIIDNIQKKHPNLKLLNNPEKKTPQALNIGVKNSSGEVIVILGAHTEIDENFIFYNNKCLNEKDVMASGGTQMNIGKSRTQKLIGQVMEIPFGMGSAKYRWSSEEQFVDTVVYAAYKKELFDELGYFEEDILISEDAEFNWRIRQAGYKIFYSPKIISKYYPRESIYKFIKQIYRYGILRVNVVKKHPDSLKLVHLIPPSFVLAIFLLAILIILNVIDFYYLIFTLITYFSVNIALTFMEIKIKKIFYYVSTPILIFFMHLSWGTGFILGLFLPKYIKK